VDGDPRDEGDSIFFSLDVLRRLGWLSLGSFKCGINVLECAFVVPESDFRHSQDYVILGQKAHKGALIEGF